MYFIYPASVSETCDRRIIPAIAKCIERFFLLQLQDAIASGVLPLSRKFDGKNYGPVLLECVKNYNKNQMLTESNILLEKKNNQVNSRKNDQKNSNTYNVLLGEIDDLKSNINSIRKTDPKSSNLINNFNQKLKDLYDKISTELNGNEKYTLLKKCGEINEILSKAVDNYDTIQRKIEKDAHSIVKDLEHERIENKEREEKEAKEKSLAHTGSYIPMDSKIDIVPTCGTVRTNILYKGGTLNGKSMESVDFNINVKVIPTIIKNFKVLENDLLDDYFSKKSESWFKTKGRNIARQSYNILKRLPFGMGDAIWKVGMTIAGEDVEKESKKDVIYNTQGFVNASAFHKSGNSPNNYNFTSNIVIFNKDDLTDPDDANIFQNRSAMVRLFKMGWSTFCMLDPVEECMYFISSLDGGYMHVVPYRYIMESYGSKAYYGTETKLKDSAKPFLIKRGNFNTFAQQFLKKRK